MDLKSFTQAIQQIADEKGIPKEKIIETIETALAAAYKRDYGKRGQIVRATLDQETGKATFRQIKIVVTEDMIKKEEEEGEGDFGEEKEPSSIIKTAKDKEEKEEDLSAEALAEAEKKVRFNPEKHLMIDEARGVKPDAEAGEELEFPLETHDDFGRIAAQTAKQVILQRVREAERESIFDEYKGREGELVSGLVQRLEGRVVFVDLGRTAGVLAPEEQIPTERYHIGERFKAIITFVEKNPKGPGIYLSRSHPNLLRRLFELEVPEIAAGTVEIKALAREPGSRSKVAVVSHDEGVDPVGSLVGQKGIRVTTVMQELAGEKIDIIEWSQEPAEFIAHALSPAKTLDVEVNEKRREAEVYVAPDQFSLSIGKGGQNVRLAAKLTGWRIDVKQRGGEKAETEKEEVKEIDKDKNGDKNET